MQKAEAETVGISKRPNVITLHSPDIMDIQYINGSFSVSDGQPYDLPPVIKGSGGVWTIDINCGRHKTQPVADRFLAICGGKDYVYNAYVRFGKSPKELNFCLGVRVTLVAAGKAAALTLYVAQGSNSQGNNWWIGSTGLGSSDGNAPVVIPIVAYDTALNVTVTRQVYEVIYASVDHIKLQTWM